MNLAKGIKSNLLYVFLPKIPQLLGYVLIPSILGIQALGDFSQYRNTILFLINISTAGIGILGLKYSRQYLDEKITASDFNKVVYDAFVLSITLSVVVFIFFNIFFKVEYLPKIISDLPAFQRAFFLLPVLVGSLTTLNISLQQGLELYRIMNKNALHILLISIVLYLVLPFVSITWLCIGLSLHYLVRYIVSRRGIRITFDINERTTSSKVLFREAIPIYLSALLITPIKWYLETTLYGLDDGRNELGKASIFIFVQLTMITVIKAVSPVLFKISSRKGEYSNKVHFSESFLTWVFPMILMLFIGLVGKEMNRISDSVFESIRWLSLSTSIILYSEKFVRDTGHEVGSNLLVIFNLLWGISTALLWYTKILPLNTYVDLLKLYAIGYLFAWSFARCYWLVSYGRLNTKLLLLVSTEFALFSLVFNYGGWLLLPAMFAIMLFGYGFFRVQA